MDVPHIILAVAWVIYCILHSVLASGSVKNKMRVWLGHRFRYYRFTYTLFSFAGLVAILLYQVSLRSPLLFRPGMAITIAGCALAAIGAAFMMLIIIKYFVQLSGMKWLVSTAVSSKLERGGLHRYVRHPLYLCTFLFIWALWLVYPYLSLLVANLIITIYTLIALRFEEKKLIVEFGEEYRIYQREVPMIVPKIYRGS